MLEHDRVTGVHRMGNVLDLGREELAPLMGRYVKRQPVSQPPPLRLPVALVVTRSKSYEQPMVEALENDGWDVQTCAGPGRSTCPLMKGEDCTLRESVDAAIVFADPGEPNRYLGTVPRIRCAADSASPGVIALEGRLDPTRYEGSTAIVGAARGPEAVLSSISALLGSRSEG